MKTTVLFSIVTFFKCLVSFIRCNSIHFILAFVGLIISNSPTYAQNIIYVNNSAAGGTNDGSSFANGIINLQDAIDMAQVGDEIRVSQGTYFPTSSPDDVSTDPRDAAFHFNKNISLRGGYNTSTGIQEANNRTILSGNIGGPSHVDNAYHVIITLNLNTTSLIEGFSIEQGFANDATGMIFYGGSIPRFQGAGMFNLDSSPTIVNVQFVDNTAGFPGQDNIGNGGGVRNIDSSPIILNCSFIDNEAGGTGGGLSNLRGTPIIRNTYFTNNFAMFGGAMHNFESAAHLINVVFSQNTANSAGSALQNTGNPPTILNNVTFYKNHSEILGGAMDNQNAIPIVHNTVFFGNTAFLLGAVAITTATGTADINTASSNNASDKIGGGIENGTNFILLNEDPFVNSFNPNGNDNIFGTADDGLVPKGDCSDGLLINKGTNNEVAMGITTDVTGQDRIFDAVVDIGAFERQDVPSDITAPRLSVINPTDFGTGTQANPFTTTFIEVISSVPTGRYFFNIDGNTFEAEIDNDTDGGGWVLILNYLHQGGTNPDLNIRDVDLPLLSNSSLGADESNSEFWGHAGNALVTSLQFDELRFYAETSNHNRVIHFKTDLPEGINYAQTGMGSFDGLEIMYSPLNGHTATIPALASNQNVDRGDLALTEIPFFLQQERHWTIKDPNNNRWEVDDFLSTIGPGNYAHSTLHRVWSRNHFKLPLNIDLTLDGNGNATLSVGDLGISPVDDCVTANALLSQTNFTCADIGSNQIDLTLEDTSGNMSTFIVDVNIIGVDAIDPVPICKNITIQLDATGNASITVDDINNGSTDNCTIEANLVLSLDITDFDSNGIGDNTVILTVEDESGNSASCTALVTVEAFVLSTQTPKERLGLTIYPNPVGNFINIKNDNNNLIENIRLYTLSGSLINEIYLERTDKQFEIPTSDLKRGIYFLTVITNLGSNHFKIVKK